MKKQRILMPRGIPILLIPIVLAVACDTTQTPSGTVDMLIYNVAGLPMELSDQNPVVNMPKIAPLLNGYQLVLVQEDFWFHADLEAGTAHPYRSAPMWETPDWDKIGDGLNRFSTIPFTPVNRVSWEQCNGLINSGGDCMTTKGFSVGRHELAPGVFLDVYNLHMDASGSNEDIAARKAQAEQLADYIENASDGVAVLVGGDTNLKATRPEDLVTLEEFLSKTGLADSCRAISCGDERIDRIMFRSSPGLELEPLEWSIPDEFVDENGNQLSDHLPVRVIFSWNVAASE